jgi:hypothetical protein
MALHVCTRLNWQLLDAGQSHFAFARAPRTEQQKHLCPKNPAALLLPGVVPCRGRSAERKLQTSVSHY